MDICQGEAPNAAKILVGISKPQSYPVCTLTSLVAHSNSFTLLCNCAHLPTDQPFKWNSLCVPNKRAAYEDVYPKPHTIQHCLTKLLNLHSYVLYKRTN